MNIGRSIRLPEPSQAWDGRTIRPSGTEWWDDATRKHAQALISPAVPVGRDVGTEGGFSPSVPSCHILIMGRWDDCIENPSRPIGAESIR